MQVFTHVMPLLQFRLNQWLLLHLRLFSVLSSAYRKPQLHSSLMSTHLMMPSRASLPRQRRAPPPKRSTLLLPKSRLWLHPRLTQRHPSPRTRPIRRMRGLLRLWPLPRHPTRSGTGTLIINVWLLCGWLSYSPIPALHSTRGAEFLLQLLLFPSLLTSSCRAVWPTLTPEGGGVI